MQNSKKVIFSTFITALVVVSFVLGVANNSESYAKVSDVTVANIDAFMNVNSLDCEYQRIEENCEITIGADANLKLFGGSIVGGDGKGTFIISGKLICKPNGEYTCKPVECIDLYEVIRSSNQQ